jgi:hypothetical protein
MKFRKKPVVVEAFRVTEALYCAEHKWKGLPEWIRDAYEKGNLVFGYDTISIKTLEGVMLANKPDWIIKGIKGELHPCRPDIFEDTYESIVIHSEE